jgi:hypothetical protein
MFHNHCRDNDSTGVAALMFAALMFAIAIFAFSIAYICAHVWLVANIGLRLMDRQWFRAAWWAMVLGLLIYIDIQAWAANAVANQ